MRVCNLEGRDADRSSSDMSTLRAISASVTLRERKSWSPTRRRHARWSHRAAATTSLPADPAVQDSESASLNHCGSPDVKQLWPSARECPEARVGVPFCGTSPQETQWSLIEPDVQAEDRTRGRSRKPQVQVCCVPAASKRQSRRFGTGTCVHVRSRCKSVAVKGPRACRASGQRTGTLCHGTVEAAERLGKRRAVCRAEFLVQYHTSFFNLVCNNSQQPFQRRTADSSFFAFPDRHDRHAGVCPHTQTWGNHQMAVVPHVPSNFAH